MDSSSNEIMDSSPPKSNEMDTTFPKEPMDPGAANNETSSSSPSNKMDVSPAKSITSQGSFYDVTRRTMSGRRVKPVLPLAPAAAKKSPPKKKPRAPRRKRPVEETEPQGPFVPQREYYHSRTFLKFKDHEWENDKDSDDEDDYAWKRELEKSDLYDFIDVTAKEKRIMSLWNDDVPLDIVIPAKNVPQMCLTFVEKHAATIYREGLQLELTFLLTNMYDEGQISADHLSVCLEQYHLLAALEEEKKQEQEQQEQQEQLQDQPMEEQPQMQQQAAT